MANVLFTNVRIIDGSGAQPYSGEVLVQGNRIARIGRGARTMPMNGVTVIDGAGATLMPGMCEAHTHFSWNNSPTLEAIQMLPVEEHTLWCASVAKTYLDHGWTSCVGAAAAKPRLDVVLRNAINAGQIPGPRYLAASQELTVAGSLGDEAPPHLPYPELGIGQVVSGPEEMRKVVRTYLKYGVDSIKLNLSGDNFTPPATAKTSWMSEEEIAMAVRETKLRGKRLAAHARSALSVKQCVKHGIEVIYHASYSDTETLDMLEANKDKHFVAPGISIIVKLLYDGEAIGINHAKAVAMGYEEEMEAACSTLKAMHKRGIRVLPGGDYGFAWAKHGENAKDLEYFVKYLGFTPMEAIVSATKYGGQIMMQGKDLGEVKEGYLADLLLVDGDPLSNIAILADKSRILAVMKDGVFYREPEMRAGRGRLGLTAA
jgi:imidazolonepropionase-like amidohydrolase